MNTQTLINNVSEGAKGMIVISLRYTYVSTFVKETLLYRIELRGFLSKSTFSKNISNAQQT